MNFQQKQKLEEIKAKYNTLEGISIQDKNGVVIPLIELSDEDLLNAEINFQNEIGN